ncbi:MAG: alpha-D-ribose 1-methylphosphonate 5-triphosphate diphosphatase [Methylobacteriaceae bacterium]|nr:alpha-D-ribose 1-methylphosphonate 5-triphosphate diphosphatase [Methylobacteriaceae bacterium]
MTDPTSPLVLAGARLVLPDRVIERGWLACQDGRIAEIGEGEAPEAAINCGGDTLIPGLVELHTDNLESHYTPRPGVRWSPVSAVVAYDAQIAASGITTVFDSLRVGSDYDAASVGADVVILAEALEVGRASGVLRAEHRTHLRCEVASPDVLESATAFLARFPAHMISLMDHTPGQRQFASLDAWKRFYTRKVSRTQAELDSFVEARLAAHARYSAEHRAALVRLAGEHGIVLASHDDTTPEHVAESIQDGVAMAEFPTTVEAARASREAGIAVMMGAPNVIRGGSHSGNVAAETLAREGLLDILSSDYVPASLLMAAFDLPRRVPEITLPEALRTVTLNPATATGLADRGAIEAGRRADLVRVAFVDEAPFAREVYRAGRRVA